MAKARRHLCTTLYKNRFIVIIILWRFPRRKIRYVPMWNSYVPARIEVWVRQSNTYRLYIAHVTSKIFKEEIWVQERSKKLHTQAIRIGLRFRYESVRIEFFFLDAIELKFLPWKSWIISSKIAISIIPSLLYQ